MKKFGVLFGFVVVCTFFVSSLFAASEKEWTFMVFLNADNNLDSYGVKDLNEMEQIGSTDQLNIVVLMDRVNGPAKKYYVKKDTSPAIVSDVVEECGEIDMGDYREMVKFVEWAKANYPARKYCLVIWNHGAGWIKSENPLGKRGISYDDQSGNHITTPQLGVACEQINAILGHPLDLLGMDACLMQMMEVAYEVKENVSYIVASEETEPGDGWPYHLILAPLAQNPAWGPEAFGKAIVDGYAQSYGTKSTTQSLVNTANVDKLARAIDSFALLLIDKMRADKALAKKIKTDVRALVTKFYYSANVDLGHLMLLFQSKIADKEINEAAALVLGYLTGGEKPVVVHVNNSGYTYKNAAGLAIYYPTGSPASHYSTTKWGKEINWEKFYKEYLVLSAATE